MKFLLSKRYFQRVLLLVVFIIIQSCVAYQTTPSTLNNALNMGPVKIQDQSGAMYKFKNIELKEGVYYGSGAVYANTEYKSTPEGVITVLDSTKYEAVYLKDKKKSKRQSVWLGVGLAAPIVFFILTIISFAIYY